MTPLETKHNVLVVDDEPRILTSIQDLLEDGFRVEAYSNAPQALERLQDHEVAVILSDQRMPGMTGDQFLSKAREISRASRILITGYTDLEALVGAVNKGRIYAYVAKPWDPKALRATVTSAAEFYRLQSELEQERDLLHALLDNLPDRIYFKDRSSLFLRINRAQALFLGLANARDAIGRNNLDLLPQEWAEGTNAEDRRIFGTGQPLLDKTEKVGFHDQPRWYSTTKVPIRDHRGQITGLVGVSRDITERKLAEEAITRQAEELARYSSELQQFAYVWAQDLQEPLGTLSTFAQLLAQRYRGQLDQPADKYIDLIVSGATRLRELIHDLLDYSQVAWRETELSPVDTQAALRGALDSLRQSIEEAGAVVTCDPLPGVLGNSGAVEQLFLHLIGNAIKFRRQAPPHIHASVRRENDRWVFSVRDNGIGIEPQYAERIFTLFRRLHAKERSLGAGIGLAICKRIVERHKGRIWVESQLGEGATFHFTLLAAE